MSSLYLGHSLSRSRLPATALKVVYEEMNLVHKDISPGNVMARINDDGATEGVLNDWGNNGPPPGTHDTNPKPPFRVVRKSRTAAPS